MSDDSLSSAFDDMPERLAARLNAAMDGYRIEEKVGEGGMAVVFVAQDLKHSRRVALKVMKPGLLSPGASGRFLREIEVAANLSHPHILPLFDSGQVDDLYYFVMPYVEGRSLRDRLRRDGALPLDEAVRITVEIAGALGHAHDRGLVHRDVKPENVLFQSGHAAVTDFGIARVVTEDEETRLTRTGVTLGTLAYMSPEQAAGNADVDGRTDVYALGCVLYEMLEGAAPFQGQTPQAVLTSKVTGRVPAFSSRASVPSTVARVVRKAMAASPADRYATPVDLARDLETAATQEAITAAASRDRRTRRARAAGALIGVAALVGSGALVTSRLVGPQIERIAVLPFENDRNDTTQVFFIDGMHDALISEMQQAGIEVIGRRSVMQYRDDATPVRQISTDLDVDAVIEGFAFREEDSVGVRLRMVDGASEAGIWSASFADDASDVLRVYRQITRAIADEIGFPLSPEAERRLASAPPVDPAAYEAYLNGKGHWNRLAPEDLELAQAYYERALRIEPDYALAHAGMASLWAGLQQMGLVSPAEAIPKIRESVARAMAADSTLAEVQFVQATVSTWIDWDWAAGEEAFLRAIASNPSYAEARAYYAHLLLFLGRPDDAVEQARLAVEIEPVSPLIGSLECVTLGHVGLLEEALARCQDVLDRDPRQIVAMDGKIVALNGLERYGELVATEVRRARDLGQEALAELLEQTYAESGYEAAMAAAADALSAVDAQGQFVPPSDLAYYFGHAGQVDEALDWLERGYEARDPAIPYFVISSHWPDQMLDSPRLALLADELGLPAPDEGG